jgi:hypothetical protein
VTIRIYTEDMSEYVEVPSFVFGDTNEWQRGQNVRMTLNGEIAVTDKAYTNRTFSGVVPELLQEKMWELKKFFDETLLGSMYRFFIRIPQSRYAKTWNAIKIPAYCGAQVISSGGSITNLKCGHAGLKCGGFINAAYEFIGPCRLSRGGFRTNQPFESIYEATIVAVVERES